MKTNISLNPVILSKKSFNWIYGIKKREQLLFFLYVLWSATTCLAGTVYYVDAAGPNDPGSGTSGDPYRWIADAIDPAVASDGDTIVIRPGIYTGQKNRDLDPQGLSITIRSIDPNDSNVVANTIIDPNGAGRGFYFDSGEDANCVVSGFIIRNAITSESGAGIYCGDSSPTITNCIIMNNSAGEYGGGVYCNNSDSQFNNCTISNNYAATDSGGGLKCDFGSPQLTNCIISNNHSTDYGGGVDCYLTNLILLNCSIIRNLAGSRGGAIYSVSSNLEISNSILWANEANPGAQLAVYEGTVSVNYCDVQGGISVVYDPYDAVSWGSGNMDEDPRFAYFDAGGTPNAWDFHLKSAAGRWASSIYTNLDPTGDGFINLTDFAAFAGFWLQQGSSIPADLDNSGLVDLADLKLLLDNYLASYLPAEWVNDDVTSPCIDAGDPNSDWSAEPWPNGKRINMGVYGGTAEASKNGNIADFDVSGQVNITDFAVFCSQWLSDNGGIVNMDLAGQVDIADFAIFAENWLWQRP